MAVDATTLGGADWSQFDPSGVLAGGLPNFLSKLQSDPNLMNRTAERTQNNEIQLATSSFERIKTTNANNEAAGQMTWADPPSAKYSQAQAKNASKVAQPISKFGKVHLVTEDGKKAMSFTPEQFTSWADERLNCGDPKIAGATQKMLDANGVVRADDGTYGVKVSQSQSMYASLNPGQATNPVGSGAFSFLQNNSWLLPTMGLATGGPSGLLMGLVGARALKSSAGAMSLAPALAGLSAGGSSYLGGNSMATFGTIACAMDPTNGAAGYAFQMKRQMTAMAEDTKMNSLISECNNPGIPIEDLIAIFMAQMADTYDQKLRDKMEETARAEKRENDRELEKNQAEYQAGIVKAGGSAIGGLLSMIPGPTMLIGAGISMAGQTAASAITQQADAKIAMEDAAGGYTKSSTVLMQEIQILMNKWKAVNELLSNLSKSLNDMAMTPIRNLR